MQPRPRSPWFKKTLLGLGACVLALVLLEGGSHLLGRFDPPREPLPPGYGLAGMGQHDPLLRWTLRPGATDEQGRRYINSDGLRGPEIAPKAPGEYRVLALGESSTFAPGMPYGQCYSALVEDELPHLWLTERPVRVVNAGVPGYSLFQGYQYLVHRGLALEPDMVLLSFGHNDARPALRDGRTTLWSGAGRPANDWALHDARRSLWGRLRESLVKHSNAYRGLLQWLRPPAADAAPGPDSGTDPAPAPRETAPRVPAEQRRRLLSMFADLCRERGITLVIVVPWYRDSREQAPLLSEFASANDLPLVDLPQILGPRLRRGPETYFSDALHPGPEGHALIADAILEVLAGIPPG